MAITFSAGDNGANWNGGTIYNGSSSQNNYGFYIGVRETYVGTSTENTSNIAIQIGIKNNGSRFNTNGWCFKYTVDGVVKDYATGVNIATNYAGYQDDVRPITIDGSNNRGMYANGIPHNDNGTKTVHIKVEMYNSSYGSYTPGYCVVEGDFTLTTIARKTSITTFNVNQRDETSLTIAWGTADTIDYAWYSRNGAAWVGVDVPDGKSGSFNVTGLTANTPYSFNLKVRRKDSQLTTETTTAKSQTTYDYPKPTSVSNFTIGNPATVNVYNPLNRSITLQLISNNNGSVLGAYSGTGKGNLSGFNDSAAVTIQYNSIPNSASGTYYAKVTYGSVVKTYGNGTYSIKGDEKPVITTTAIDTNKTLSDSSTATNKIQNLTNDTTNKTIIKFISDVQVSVSGTGQYGTTMDDTKYATQYGTQLKNTGSTNTYQNVESISFTGYGTDKRNLSNNSTATGLTLVNYIKLTLDDIELYRDDQTSNTLKCKGNGDYYTGQFGTNGVNNAITFKLRYKEHNTSTWGSWSTKTMAIGTNTYSFDFQVGTTFDYTKAYDFEFDIRDKCMGFVATQTSKPGIPVQGLFENFQEAFGVKTFEVDGNGDVELNSNVIPFNMKNTYTQSTDDGYCCDYINSMNEYSTSETFTGRYWVDSKPIYRKAISGSSYASGTTLVSGVSTFIRAYGTGDPGTGLIRQLPYFEWYNNKRYCCRIHKDGSNLKLDSYLDGSAHNASLNVVIEYTKTS